MAHLSRRQKIAASATALVLVGSGTAAFAYWSTTGSGSGTASTAAGASNLSIVQTSTVSGLAPGANAQSIAGTVTNNATNTAYVNQVTVSILSVTGGAGSCDATDYSISNPTMPVAQDLAAGGSANFSGASIAFVNKTTNQDGCKGATVNLAYTSN